MPRLITTVFIDAKTGAHYNTKRSIIRRMGRRLYFLPVRGHLGDARLMAAFDAAQNKSDKDDKDENTETKTGGIIIQSAKTAADVESQNAAVAVILTYADIDISAARELLNTLPACGGGVFCIIAQTPEGAPFLSKLRERANTLQNDKNAVMIIELAAAATSEHYNDTAEKLREMILADNATFGADNTNETNNKTAADAVRSAHKAVEDLL